MEVRIRTTCAWLHVPLEQPELPPGRGTRRHEPYMGTRRTEGEAIHVIAGTELGTHFPGIAHVGHQINSRQAAPRMCPRGGVGRVATATWPWSRG